MVLIFTTVILVTLGVTIYRQLKKKTTSEIRTILAMAIPLIYLIFPLHYKLYDEVHLIWKDALGHNKDNFVLTLIASISLYSVYGFATYFFITIGFTIYYKFKPRTYRQPVRKKRRRRR